MPNASFETSSISTCGRELGNVFNFDLIEDKPNIVVLRVSGKGAGKLFKHEAGGHRWQGDSGGKTHTSTVTVAVLREPAPTELVIQDKDLEWTTMRGSGAGGQHRNKTESAVCVKHLPSGASVRCESERSQLMNKNTALALLRARLLAAKESASTGAYNDVRRKMLGSGMRGDKRRTIQEQNGIVVDHVTGRRTDVKSYLKGDLDWLA